MSIKNEPSHKLWFIFVTLHVCSWRHVCHICCVKFSAIIRRGLRSCFPHPSLHNRQVILWHIDNVYPLCLYDTYRALTIAKFHSTFHLCDEYLMFKLPMAAGTYVTNAYLYVYLPQWHFNDYSTKQGQRQYHSRPWSKFHTQAPLVFWMYLHDQRKPTSSGIIRRTKELFCFSEVRPEKTMTSTTPSNRTEAITITTTAWGE